jgi:hypothetical protein
VTQLDIDAGPDKTQETGGRLDMGNLLSRGATQMLFCQGASNMSILQERL